MSKKLMLMNHYLQIRDTIKMNISTIKGLILQADSLKDLAESLGESDGNEVIIASLKSTAESINNSISELIDQTDQLFTNYEAFVKQVFSGE